MSRPGWNDRDVGGYLAKDPELRTTSKGTSVCNISLACPLYYNKENITEWVNAALFGHNADFCCKYAKKGDLVRITGMQVTKKYTGKDGVEKSSIELQGQTFMLLKTAKDRGKDIPDEMDDGDAPL